MDYAKVYSNLVQGTKNYIVKNNLKAMILGLSGGLDSTVVAAIASQVTKESGIPLIGVSLPCETNGEDENHIAKMCGKEFCNEFSMANLQLSFENINTFCTAVSGITKTPISQGNIKARLRMIVLYDIASKRQGIVLDSDNLSEYHLGYYTIHGDSCDLTPIGGLWKTEVYGLAKWINDNVYDGKSEALKAAIEITPTDGNGVSNSDMDQIAPGLTYNEVDEILQTWVGMDESSQTAVLRNGFSSYSFDKLSEKYGHDIVKRVISRSINSEFKRKQTPFVVNPTNGEMMEHNGQPLQFIKQC